MATRGKYKSNLRGYKAYVALYNARKKELKKLGYTMAQRKLRKAEWDATYEAEKNDRLDDIASGKRKTVGDVNRAIVKSQTNTVSSKVASAYAKGQKKAGNKIKVKDIQYGKIQINWEEIREYKQTLRDSGMSWGEINEKIGQDLFGSP